MANTSKRRHYFMFSVKLIYERDGVLKSKEMNAMLKGKTDNITYDDLASIQRGCQERLFNEGGISFEQVKDCIVGSINRLGHMTDEEFNGTQGVQHV